METVRQGIARLLSEREHTALELSKMLQIREKEVCEHLAHLKRSLASQRKILVITPAHCLECGYDFESRSRLTKPGRCPRCKGEHIEDPRYRVTEERGSRPNQASEPA